MKKDHLIERIVNGEPSLSEDQKKAVLSKSRYSRVIAGAGAGKTETLTRRIAYLLLVEDVKPTSIVAFTFTEKAAQSMKSRIYQRIAQIAGLEATKNLGEMYVGTIHAYAKRILEDYFRYGNHGVLDDNQEIAFLMRHGWSLGINDYGGLYADCCRSFLRTVNMVWDEMLDEKMLQKRSKDFSDRMKQYEGLLKRHRQLTFGRMIYEAVLNLRKAPEKLSHIKHLIIDEFQDINQAQAELITLVGKNGNIFVVGDPRQSIYQWRGSDERFFDEFSRNFPKTKEVTIPENHRSTKRIVRNANSFAHSFVRRNYEEMDSTRKEKGFVGVVSHESPEDEARWIADQIEVLMKGNEKLKFSDFGVLTRSVSTSAGPVIDELKRKEIPYIVGGKVGLFKRDEAQAVGRIFAWFWSGGFWLEDTWNWGDRTVGDTLLDTALASWDAAHRHGHSKDAKKRLARIKKDLSCEKSPYDNFTRVYQDVLNALGFRKLSYRILNDAAVMANLGRFNNLLTDYESANRIGGRTAHWENDLKGLCYFMNSYALKAYEEQPSDDIRGVDAVQVMTVHQAKGLEWPIVFLFATVGRRFPASMVGREQNWCGVPRDMFDVKRYEGDIEDERRLFYVAITRARDALVVSHFKKLKRNVAQSEFIDAMDATTLTNLEDSEPLPDMTLHPGLMSDEIQTFSADEVITYDICPYMYLLRDIWGYQPELNEAIGFGNSLHYCLRRAGELIQQEDCRPTTAVEKAVDEGFHLPFVGGVVLDNFKNSAKRMLVSFAKTYGDDLERIEEVEYRLEYPIQNATIMGKVDVILKDDGGMEVRDYKTSDKVRTFAEISVQVRLYAAGLKSIGRSIVSGSVAYLEKPDVKPVTVAGSALCKEVTNAERVVDGIMKRRFRPRPGKPCLRCDQKPICRWKT
jgi:DNA helicase-2/ATP-dependent DNA helicase PcrA